MNAQISKPVKVTSKQAKRLAETWSKEPSRNQVAYAKYFLETVAALPKDVPMDDERRKPNLMVPVAMSMHREADGIGLIRKMRIDPLAKSMILIPIYIKAVADGKTSVSEVCLTVGNENGDADAKKVDAKKWLSDALRKKFGKRIFKSGRIEREARIEGILSLCRFEGNKIYINPASKVEIVDARKMEMQMRQGEPNGKVVAMATNGVPIAEPVMTN